MNPRARLARLHCVNALLHSLTGNDLYLAAQVLGAIEAAAESGAAAGKELAPTLASLHQALLGHEPDAGFSFCDGASENASGPLFIQAELLTALRRNAARARATIMVGNLPPTTGPSTPRRQKRAAESQARDHADMVAHLRGLAARRASPRSQLTLLFV